LRVGLNALKASCVPSRHDGDLQFVARVFDGVEELPLLEQWPPEHGLNLVNPR
jgi:hypothetical protein